MERVIQCKQINLLLTGKTGVGKSSTGNSIVRLEKKPFKTGSNTTSLTKQCQVEYARVMERELKVVDGPGMADSEMDDFEATTTVIDETRRAVKEISDGYDAILIVICFGRLSKDDKKTVDQLKGVFGKNFIAEYGILLVTCVDLFDPDENEGQTFEQWCQKQTGVFQKLLSECCGRVVGFDNKTKDEKVQENQLKRLFQVVDKMKYGPRRYTRHIFQVAEGERDRLLLDAKEPVIREETEGRTRLIMHDLNKITLNDPEGDITMLTVVRNDVKALLEDTRKQDKGTGALNKVIQTIESVSVAVDEKLRMAEAIIQNNAKEKEMNEKFAKEKAEHEEEREEWQKEKKQNEQRLEDMIKSLERSCAEMDSKYKAMVEERRKDGNKQGFLQTTAAVVELLSSVANLTAGISNAVTNGMKAHNSRKF